MQADQFLGVWRRRPFRPFVVRTGSGESYPVRHPEQALISESGRTVAVSLPEEQIAIIDMESITEIVAGPSRGRRKAGGGA